MDDFKGADDKATDDKGAWAEVDKEAVRENIAYVRSLLPEGTRFCAVLKGNAYG
ncbi:MAG: alanine racemase, partial [Blautia sp.]|nr:alanine racemase [Blautia sp.]